MLKVLPDKVGLSSPLAAERRFYALDSFYACYAGVDAGLDFPIPISIPGFGHGARGDPGLHQAGEPAPIPSAISAEALKLDPQSRQSQARRTIMSQMLPTKETSAKAARAVIERVLPLRSWAGA